MATSADVSALLRDRVQARMTELNMAPGELAAETGLSPPALANLRNGLIRRYSVRLKREVCHALNWTTDSIDRLLRDEEPVEAAGAKRPVAEAAGSPAQFALASDVDAEVEALWAALVRLSKGERLGRRPGPRRSA